jgi:hypothetical protein
MCNLVEKFKKADTSDLLDLDSLITPLDMALWVLLTAKDKYGIDRLSAEDIAVILVEAKERSVTHRAIANAFNRAKGKKVHVSNVDSKALYQIMKKGRDHLLQKAGADSIQVYHFEPGRRYTSKSILRRNVLSELKGGLKIVDPYCGIGTLDLIISAGAQKVQLLTRLASLNNKKKQDEFLRDFNEFKTEHQGVEVRDWKESELHDRYILSNRSLVILGQSIKDVGAKESFAVVFERKHFESMVADLEGAFDRRWKIATII